MSWSLSALGSVWGQNGLGNENDLPSGRSWAHARGDERALGDHYYEEKGAGHWPSV